MHSAAARIGGLVVGLFIIVLGFSLLTQEAGLDGSARTKALVYALTALGIGVTAASLLPNSLNISGEKFKPLGASFPATGGAAFFVATLIFLFYTEDSEPAQGKEDGVIEGREQAGGSKDGPESAPGPSTVASLTPAPAQTSDPAPQPVPQQAPQQLAAMRPGLLPNPYGPVPTNTSGITRVRTYCSDCCPGGPIGCGQVGGAQSYDVDEAELAAYGMCLQNGGGEAACLFNLEQF
ncbi:hypothetical protein LY632_04520 [Erythrobacter sp. SDW2]|uniref:hypothetical protein n=1 Tax=Erythrobacter sp. SDW2 TaxID=2907154 RepID=UPI001F197B82|nr:hypothetical protein [Erythrobacter sp. SDW2]UIP07669.1 hypothetical protein LY632_04520 [Erythrobacter sp. SDW2]